MTVQYAERIHHSELAEHQFFLALRERIERIVRWYVRSSDDDVDDLTQECLIRVYNSLERVHDLEKLEPWLKTVVRNTVFTWFRDQKREREVCEIGLEAETELEVYSMPEDDLLLYLILQEAMQTLSDADRQMFELRYGVGLSYREIALQMGLNEEVVRKRISRALARLRTHPIIQSIIAEGG